MRRLAPLAAVFVLAACGGSSSATLPPGAIALVGDRVVTRAAFDHELAQSRAAYAAEGRAFPKQGTAAYRHVRDAAVEVLVDRAQLELRAERAKISIPDARVETRLERLKQVSFGGSEQRYRRQLRSTGMTEADVRDAIRVQLLAESLRGVDSKPARVVFAPGFGPRA